jgi:4-amino-4-deoxy-L-arabinose transferase-like glycosyltransferase
MENGEWEMEGGLSLPAFIRRNLGITVILVAFAVLGVLYSVVNPLAEAPDEDWHYDYVKYVADGRGLPVQHFDPSKNIVHGTVGHHPPLYYGLSALLTFWINTDDADRLLWDNPHFLAGLPHLSAFGNKNRIIHTDAEAFPYQGTALAMHIVRLLSVLFSGITVLTTYLIALEIFPDWKPLALGAAALNAFNPQFLFIGARISNDTAVTAFSALVLLGTIRLLKRGATKGRLIWLGVTLGLALLSKISALALLPLVAVGLAIRAIRQRSPGSLLKWGLAVFPLAFLIAWWPYLRNWLLYRDPLATNVWLAAVNLRLPTPSLIELSEEFWGLEISFWAVFGWMNILVPEVIYQSLAVMTRLAALGLLLLVLRQFASREPESIIEGGRFSTLIAKWRSFLGSRRRLDRPAQLGLLLLGLWCALLFISLLRFMQIQFGAQGRYLFPAIPAISIFIFLGLSQFVPQRYSGVLAGVIGGALFLLAVICPFVYIAPAYAKPPVIAAEDIPAEAHRLDVNFGDKIRLLACQLDKGAVKRGDPLSITLYWQPLAEMEQDYNVFIHVLGRDEQVIAQEDTYPGMGSYPTSLWQVGGVIKDTYGMYVRPESKAPSRFRVEVGVYDRSTGEVLRAFDEQGRLLRGVTVAQGKVTTRQEPRYSGYTPVAFDLAQPFGEVYPEQSRRAQDKQVSLTGYKVDKTKVKAGETIEVALYWRAQKKMTEDYTVFVHVVDEKGTIWGQHDSQPLNGYYPTPFWGQDEIVKDEHAFVISEDTPPGEYWIEVGMYRLADGQRLVIVDQDGQVLDDKVLLSKIAVK